MTTAVSQSEPQPPDLGLRAAWTEHCAIGLMADALGRAPPAAMVEPPAAPDPVREAEPTAEPQADIAAEADFYAAIYPQRAALIRGHGGLPAKLDFGPPSPELVRAIVTGTSPALQALDTADHHAMGAVAGTVYADGHAAPPAPS